MKLRKCHCCGGSGKEIDPHATGEELRKLREKANLSLRAVSSAMGISGPYLSDLERGNRGWSEALIKKYREVVNQ